MKLQRAQGSQVKSVQRGVLVMGGAQSSVNQTIAAVNTAKSTVRLLGFASYEDSPRVHNTYISLINSNTLQFNRNTTGSFGVSVSWEIIELY